jgi:hypothetical protein
VVDGVALARERAEAVSLRKIAVKTCPACARVEARHHGQVLTDGRLLVQQLQKRELVGLERRCGWVVRNPLPARTSIFLATVSGALIALGLMATATRVGTAFYAFALILLSTLSFVGLVTFERTLRTSAERKCSPVGTTSCLPVASVERVSS